MDLAVIIKETAGLAKLADGLWRSERWLVPAERHAQLIGGTFSVHGAQSKPSHFGGQIVHVEPLKDGRCAIIFRAAESVCRGGVDGRALKWGQEKAYAL